MTINFSNYQTCSFWNVIYLTLFGRFKCKRCKFTYEVSIEHLQLKDYCYECCEEVNRFEKGYFWMEEC